MSVYAIRKTDSLLLTAEQIQQMHPETSFDFSAEGLSGSDYALLTLPPQPIIDGRFYRAEPDNIRKYRGTYKADWLIIPLEIDIETAYAQKIEEINAQCTVAICAGFYSSAAGDTYHYSSDMEAQFNIMGNVMDALTGNNCEHICYDLGGIERTILHTPDQMIQVGRDLKAHVWFNVKKARNIKRSALEERNKNNLDKLVELTWQLQA